MSNRGITGATLLAEVGKHSVEYYECVDIQVGNGYYITNAPRNITIGGQEYIALGQLLDFGDVEENVTFEVSQLELRVSALPAYDDNDESWTLRILSETYQNREVVISRAYFDADANHVGSFEIYKGYIDGVGVKHTPTGESAVSIDTSSHWVDFERTNGRFTNTQSQQHAKDLNPGLDFYENDEGFSFASKVQKDIEWK